MSLYNRLVKLKKKLGKTALRSPNTDKEKITRKNAFKPYPDINDIPN